MVSRPQFRRYPLAALLVGLLLVAALSSNSRSASNPTYVAGNVTEDCIEGHFWPADISVQVTVRDTGGDVLYSDRTRTDAKGGLAVPCGFLSLHSGMSITASDGDTTKVVRLERVTFDGLDPTADTAAGTAPVGPVDVYVYDGQDELAAHAPIETDASGSWFVDVGALGGRVEEGSFGDAFVYDEDGDQTVADVYVTALSLDTSVGGGSAAAARKMTVTRGTRVRLTGRLSAGNRGCVRKKRVTLLKVSGKRHKALESARTDGKGRYSFNRTMKRTTSFRVRYRGRQGCQRSRSRLRVVRVGRA